MMISNATELALSFARTLPREASRVLDPLDESDVAAFIVTVPADVAGAVLRNMLRWRAAACLECLPLDKTATILESMDFYDAVDILRQIPSSERSSILTELPRGLARSIKTALRYPDGTVGALMNPALPMFPHDATVKEAISQVRNWRTNIGHVFLYRDEKRFHAAVPVSALVKVRSGTSLMSIAENDVAPVFSHADVRSVSQEADWDNYPVRPVVSASRRLLGGLSRSVVRLHQQHPSAWRSKIGPTTLAGNVFTAYVQSCNTLLGLMAGLLGNGSAAAGTERRHDRKR